MDKEREIRFLYPPLIIGAYFLWGWLGDIRGRQELDAIICWFRGVGDVKGSLAGILTGGSLILVIGYLLGTLTYVALRLMSRLMFHSSHEIPTDESTRGAIWKAAGITGRNAENLDELQMSTVWLDFHMSKKTVHEWIVRRWNAFNISANIVAGILLCWGWRLAFADTRQIPQGWCLFGMIALVVFFENALTAHKDTMGMLKFAAEKVASDTAPKGQNAEIDVHQLS